MSPTWRAAASPSRSPANADTTMNAPHASGALPSRALTCAVVGSVIAASGRRTRGSAMPSLGSDAITRSRTAATEAACKATESFPAP